MPSSGRTLPVHCTARLTRSRRRRRVRRRVRYRRSLNETHQWQLDENGSNKQDALVCHGAVRGACAFGCGSNEALFARILTL